VLKDETSWVHLNIHNWHASQRGIVHARVAAVAAAAAAAEEEEEEEEEELLRQRLCSSNGI